MGLTKHSNGFQLSGLFGRAPKILNLPREVAESRLRLPVGRKSELRGDFQLARLLPGGGRPFELMNRSTVSNVRSVTR